MNEFNLYPEQAELILDNIKKSQAIPLYKIYKFHW